MQIPESGGTTYAPKPATDSDLHYLIGACSLATRGARGQVQLDPAEPPLAP